MAEVELEAVRAVLGRRGQEPGPVEVGTALRSLGVLVTDAVVRQTDSALEANELVKCSVQGTSGMDTREAAIALARPTHAEVVQVIGHKFVLYRTSQREDIEHIQLV